MEISLIVCIQYPPSSPSRIYAGSLTTQLASGNKILHFKGVTELQII